MMNAVTLIYRGEVHTVEKCEQNAETNVVSVQNENPPAGQDGSRKKGHNGQI